MTTEPMLKELSLVDKPKNFLRKDLEWGFFKGNFKKKYDDYREKLYNESRTNGDGRFEIGECIKMLQEIETIFQESKKSPDMKLYVSLERDYNGEYSYLYIDFEYGRYETDLEWKTRLLKEHEWHEKCEAERLRSEAKKYLELKNKFEGSK